MIVTVGDDVISNGGTQLFDNAEIDDSPQTVVFSIENNGTKKITLGEFGLESGFKIIAYSPTISVGDTGSVTVQTVTKVPGTFFRPINFGGDFAVNLSLFVAEDVPTYTTRDRLNGMFGKVNIDSWADLDGTQNPNDLEYTIFLATNDAAREVDGYLSTGTYVVPFVAPAPEVIQKITGWKAGIALYTIRGMYAESFDKMMGQLGKRSDSILEDIRRGKMIFPGDLERRVTSSGPMVVN